VEMVLDSTRSIRAIRVIVTEDVVCCVRSPAKAVQSFEQKITKGTKATTTPPSLWPSFPLFPLSKSGRQSCSVAAAPR